ncbi:MAG: class I SAM-dependent methyltransferase [Planctomycetota bacterium]
MNRQTACRVCQAPALEELHELVPLGRVTSDCRPWPAGGHLAACTACGLLQKPHEPDWEADCHAIYAGYELYPQAAGVEQAVYEPGSGMPATRSARLLDQIATFSPLPEAGRLLDVGCGNGGFLRAFHARAPGWRLNGTDLHGRYRKDVEAIGGVEGFHQLEPEVVPGEFDWIVLLHVLEHIPSPIEFLERLRTKLRPGGRLVIEVPDHRSWPFDLAIADHASHFSAETLRALLVRAGYSLQALASDWVPKELTALAIDRAGAAAEPVNVDVRATLRGARSALKWLTASANEVRSLLTSTRSISVFGSSIGATWLAAQFERRVICFIDEDPSRAGRSHMGVPILTPDHAPIDVPLYLALPPFQAQDVQQRLKAHRGELRTVLPPVID